MNCNPLTENTTQIPKNVEFVAILCQRKSQNRIVGHQPRLKIVDMFAFTPPKLPKVPLIIQKGEGSQKLNVIILGLDTTSHMNFLRNMPRSYLYLTQNLSAIGMHGFTSLRPHTFSNAIPILSGISGDTLRNSCYPIPHGTPDNCYFIWQNFTEAGYLTSFAEDSFSISIFKYGNSTPFKKPPVDYYFHNFASVLENTIGHTRTFRSILCYGPRLGFVTLLNYIQRLAISLPEKRRYFQFVWATSLFHNNQNGALIGDDHLLRTLEWFQENGFFEKTVFILIGDHGLRHGDFRFTAQVRTLQILKKYLKSVILILVC